MTELSVQRQGALTVVTITPADGFMNRHTVAELDALTRDLEADEQCRGVIFTGGHKGVFMRHYDVRELAAMSDALRAKGASFGEARPVEREREIDGLLGRLGSMAKITIAAINGFAMGGGFEFCLACDLRIAAAGDYEVGLPELKIGLLPGAGGTQRLLRFIGPARAAELLLCGGTLSPSRAQSYGMLNEVVDGPVLPAALDMAQRYATMPPVAFAHIKRLLREGAERPLPEALVLERTLFLDTLVSDDANRLMTTMNAEDRDIRAMSARDASLD